MLFLERFNMYKDIIYSIYFTGGGYRVCYIYRVDDFHEIVVDDVVLKDNLKDTVILIDDELDCFLLNFKQYGVDHITLKSKQLNYELKESSNFIDLNNAEIICKDFIDQLWEISNGICRKDC